jgi:hypothetical protein
VLQAVEGTTRHREKKSNESCQKSWKNKRLYLALVQQVTDMKGKQQQSRWCVGLKRIGVTSSQVKEMRSGHPFGRLDGQLQVVEM